MIKAGPKSTKAVAQAKGKVLYAENDRKVLDEQSKIFENAGYTVERVQGRKEAEQALKNGTYDVVVLGHTLTKDDRHHLPYMAKKSFRHTQVLVLHASGKHHAVDLSLDSRDGEEAITAAINSLVERKYMAAAV
jgi:DNA-binding NtrC family response regulator